MNVDVLLYNTSDDTYVLEDFSGQISELPVPTLTGYVFAGWFLDPELTERPLGTETFLEDTTVYAKWTPALNNVYLLYEQYVLGRFLLGYQEEFELTDVTLNGFTFMGWYSDIELASPITTITGLNETMYVYGKYEQEVMNFPPQTTVNLSSLGYESYLDPTNPVVHITVEDIGTMSLQLFPGVAKNTVDNFIFYIESEAYQGSTFHRIIEDFMIQGGIVATTACPIEGQFTDNGLPNDLSHTRGALSMARTSVMNSATSQFFIVHNDSLFLDGSYATFGGLVNGFDVLDYLATLTTSSTDAPIRDVIIEDVTIEYNGYVPGTPICAS
jgi:peptidyl-prolyl cis-trans isomerase B (cyclophilin B)